RRLSVLCSRLVVDRRTIGLDAEFAVEFFAFHFGETLDLPKDFIELFTAQTIAGKPAEWRTACEWTIVRLAGSLDVITTAALGVASAAFDVIVVSAVVVVVVRTTLDVTFGAIGHALGGTKLGTRRHIAGLPARAIIVIIAILGREKLVHAPHFGDK